MQFMRKEDIKTYLEEKLSEELIKVFTEVGIKSKTVKIENNGEFSEAILLQKNEISTEKMVRIYRGINHLDASVLEQIPYAMRKENQICYNL